MGFNCLKATATSRRQFTFYHSVPRNSWYSFYRPRKDERLSRPWSHPVVLNTGPLDWESSALTTWPLLHKRILNWLISFYIVASFWCTPLVILDFCSILFASNTVIWASLAGAHRSKLEVKGFTFHVVVFSTENFHNLIPR